MIILVRDRGSDGDCLGVRTLLVFLVVKDISSVGAWFNSVYLEFYHGTECLQFLCLHFTNYSVVLTESKLIIT